MCAGGDEGDIESRRAGAAALEKELAAASERYEHQRVLDIAAELRPLQERLGDAKGAAFTDAYRGAALASLARYAEAREALERALAALEGGDAAPQVVQILLMLGGIHCKLSEYARALDRFDQAAARLPGAEAAELRADVLIAQGDVWTELEDYPRAKSLYDAALRLVPDRPGLVRAHARAALGWLLHLSGESLAGMRELRAAAEEYERVGDLPARANVNRALGQVHFDRGEIAEEYEQVGDLPARANVNRALGQVHFDRGEIEEAVRQYELAIPLQDDAPPEAAHTWICLARARRHAGQAEEAALALAEAGKLLAGSEARDILILLERETAEQALVRGDGASAVRAMRNAFATLREVVEGLSDAGMTGTESHRDRSPLFDVALRAAVATGDPRVVFEMLEEARAQALIYALGGRAALGARTLPGALEERRRIADARLAEAREAHEAAVREGDRKAVAATAAAVSEAEAEFAAAVDAAQRASRRERISAARVASLDDLQSALSEEEAMAAFLLLPDAARALVVTREAANLRTLGRSDEIVRGVETLETRLGGSGGFDTGALRQVLLERLELPAGIRRVLVSPDGPLAHMPFPILLGEKDPEVAIVPSSTALVLLRREGGRRGRGVLALGDPAYGTEPAPSAPALLRDAPLTRLPATRAEVLAITGPDDVRLLGAEATETRFLAEAASRRWSAIHLACHGIADGVRPGMSGVALTPEKGRDGLVTALDIFDSPIGADLVVLSGCRTGRGKVVRAEGSMGLARAFLAARVPRVVVSLWSVDDEATRALMTKFHERWRAGIPTAKALREAQEHVRSTARWEHPRFWAGWALWGLPD